MFELLSEPQQVHLITSFIINYICFDCPGSCEIKEVTPSGTSMNATQLFLMNRDHDLNMSFITLCFLVRMILEKIHLEMVQEADEYSDYEEDPFFNPRDNFYDDDDDDDEYDDVIDMSQGLRQHGSDLTCQELSKIGDALVSVGEAVTKRMQQMLQRAQSVVQQESSSSNALLIGSKTSRKIIASQTIETLSLEVKQDLRNQGTRRQTDFRDLRKQIANIYKEIVPQNRYNKNMQYCTNMHVWIKVLRVIFSKFFVSYPEDMYTFANTKFSDRDVNFVEMIKFVERTMTTFKTSWIPQTWDIDAFKLALICYDAPLFTGKDGTEHFTSEFTSFTIRRLTGGHIEKSPRIVMVVFHHFMKQELRQPTRQIERA